MILKYGQYSSWKLREITHNEISWRNSRKGLFSNEIGNNQLTIEDIKKDAGKVRQYEPIWDMYYDEFEDVSLPFAK